MKVLKVLVFMMVLTVFFFSLSNILHSGHMSITGWVYNICAFVCSVSYLWFNMK